MADLSQLETAFMNAHQKGDKASAKVIAAEIKRQRAAAKPPVNVATPEAAPNPFAVRRDQYGTESGSERMGLDVGSALTGAAQSVADLGNAFSMGTDFINQSIGKLPLGDYIKPVAQGMFPALGLKEQNMQVPVVADDKRSRGIRKGFEWGTPIPMAALSKADPLIGLAAGGGSYLADTTGEMVGGIGASIGSMVQALRGKGVDYDYEQAKAFLKEHATDADTALENLEISLKNNDKGSLAELTNDQGIYNLEASARKGSPLKVKLDALTQQRFDKISGDISGELGAEIPYRNTEDLQAKAAKQVARLEKSIAAREAREVGRNIPPIESQLFEADEALNQAQQGLTKAKAMATTDLPESEASSEFYRVLKEQDAADKAANVQPLYEAFESGEPVSGKQFIDAVRVWGDENLNTEQAKIIQQRFGNLTNLIKDLDDEISPSQVQTIVSEMKSTINNALKPGGVGGSTSNKKLIGITESLEDALLGTSSGGIYEEATSAYAQNKQRFSPARLAKAAKNQEPETFFESLLTQGAGGKVVANEVLGTNSPEIVDAFKEGFKAVANKEGITPAFMKKNAELLDSFPDIKRDFESVIKAEGDVTAATEKVSKLPAAIKSQSKKVKDKAQEKTSRLSKTVANKQIAKLKDDPNGFIDQSIVHHSANDLTQINKQMGTIEGGKEKLKLAVKERVLNKIVKDKTGDLTITPEAVGEFNAMKRNLIDSGILTKDEVISIENSINKAKQTTKMRKSSAVQRADKADEILQDFIASGLSVAALRAIPNATNQLMVAGVIRRSIGKLIDTKDFDPKVISALEDIMVNPEKFITGAANQGVKTDEQMMKYITTLTKAVSQSVTEDE